MKSVAMIGQAPARGSNPTRAFCPETSRSGKRLVELCPGIFDHVETFNLLSEYPGRGDKNNPRGDSFDIRTARFKAADVIAAALRSKRSLLLMGEQVADAFGVREFPFLSWRYYISMPSDCPLITRFADEHDDLEYFKFAIFPHPSGVNRWWNDEANVREAKKFLKKIVQGEFR